MNLEVTLICLVFIIVMVRLFSVSYSKETAIMGNWLEIEKDEIGSIKGIEWDISAKNRVFIPNFVKLPSFRRNMRTFHKLKGTQAIDMDFSSTDEKSFWTLYVYNSDYRLIKSYKNPTNLLFTCSRDIMNAQYVDENKKYIFLLKYYSPSDKDFNYNLTKYQDVGEIEPPRYVEPKRIEINENELSNEFFETTKKVIEEMGEKGYSYMGIRKAEEHILFPSSEIIFSSQLKAFKGDVLILMCINRKETSGVNDHRIEINSELMNSDWEPNCKETVSLLRLENLDQDNKFSFFERLYASDDSIVLPFQVLSFKPKNFIS